MTNHIASLKPGQTLAFKGPIQKFVYQPNEIEHGLFISGGSGITPMYQVITHALSLPEDKTKLTLLFANVSEKDICKLPGVRSRLTRQCSAKNGTLLQSLIPIASRSSTCSTRLLGDGRERQATSTRR